MKSPIIHRDLKPANLVINVESSTPVIKVTDFGFARRFSNTKSLFSATMCGSENYTAPEVLPDETGSVGYSAAVDIFSLGVIYLAMVNYEPGQSLKAIKGKSMYLYFDHHLTIYEVSNKGNKKYSELI